jgi:hypothetical protein
MISMLNLNEIMFRAFLETYQLCVFFLSKGYGQYTSKFNAFFNRNSYLMNAEIMPTPKFL